MGFNVGAKISKEGQDVKEPITEENAKNFQLISSKDCLTKKELSFNRSSQYAFWTITEEDGKVRSPNASGNKKYLIFANQFDA